MHGKLDCCILFFKCPSTLVGFLAGLISPRRSYRFRISVLVCLCTAAFLFWTANKHNRLHPETPGRATWQSLYPLKIATKEQNVDNSVAMDLRNDLKFIAPTDPPVKESSQHPTAPEAKPTHARPMEVNDNKRKDHEPFREKWIVITTVQLPTDAVRTMASQRGWSVVAVGDKKTPPNWQLENCVFLSVQEQAKLGFNIHSLIPYKHYGRKNIGYLYAIKHGAKVIYDTDDDNELIVDSLDDAFQLNIASDTSSFRQRDNMFLYKGNQGSEHGLPVVNPYVHFGQPNLWPRGYPLVAITRPDKVGEYYRGSRFLKPYIQQGLANGDPDVDAIFRVTRKRSGAKIDLTFDRDAPAVALPPDLMSPFNTQNTLIHEQAFWGLLVPVTTTFRVCDIWRGYWVQRVLWEIGGSLSFHPPSVYQDRNEHNYFLDHVDEHPLYNDSGRFVEFLVNWQPPAGSLFLKVRDLARKMAKEGFWKKGDARLVDAWLRDLEAIGYKPPAATGRAQSEKLWTITADYIPSSLPSPYTRSISTK